MPRFFQHKSDLMPQVWMQRPLLRCYRRGGWCWDIVPLQRVFPFFKFQLIKVQVPTFHTGVGWFTNCLHNGSRFCIDGINARHRVIWGSMSRKRRWKRCFSQFKDVWGTQPCWDGGKTRKFDGDPGCSIGARCFRPLKRQRCTWDVAKVKLVFV